MSSKRATKRQNASLQALVDAETIEGCQARESYAQERLYGLCHARIYHLMVRMVGLQDAADLTQQIFLQAFRKIDQYAGQSKFETWFYRLAINEALQYLRKTRRRSHLSLTQEPMCQNQPEQNRRDMKELLEEALSRLEPEVLSVFILHEVEKLTYREIAEVKKIAEGTVGSRMNRARRELKQHLTDLGWEP
ncbi:MAG: RNA polymerase sigma factor [Gimesia chilikensis]|uniref:RNA polymerase sigma factor n=1 Tax=Gimesia chilikensis TaxID=2605989 RepID=UPI0037A8F772